MQWPPLLKDLRVQGNDDGDDDQPVACQVHLQTVLLKVWATKKKDHGAGALEGVARGSQWGWEERQGLFIWQKRTYAVCPPLSTGPGELLRYSRSHHLPSSVAWNTFPISHASLPTFTHVKFGLCLTFWSPFARDLIFSFMKYLWRLLYWIQLLFYDLRAHYDYHLQRCQILAPNSVFSNSPSKFEGGRAFLPVTLPDWFFTIILTFLSLAHSDAQIPTLLNITKALFMKNFWP